MDNAVVYCFLPLVTGRCSKCQHPVLLSASVSPWFKKRMLKQPAQPLPGDLVTTAENKKGLPFGANKSSLPVQLRPHVNLAPKKMVGTLAVFDTAHLHQCVQ